MRPSRLVRRLARTPEERRLRHEYSKTKHDCLPSVVANPFILFSPANSCCCINLHGLHTDCSLSAALEAGNQFVGFAWIEQAHGGQRPRAAPGMPVDHEARCADRNVQAAAVSSRRPQWRRSNVRLPSRGHGEAATSRAARSAKSAAAAFGHGVEIDQPVLDGERYAARCQRGCRLITLPGLRTPRRARSAAVAVRRDTDQLIAVAAAEAPISARMSAILSTADRNGTALRRCWPSPPLDQIGLRQLRQRLAHGHSRAAIARHQLVLERDAMTGGHSPVRMRRSMSSRICLYSVGLSLTGFRGRWRGSCHEPPYCRVECGARAGGGGDVRSRRLCFRPPTHATAPEPAAKIQPSRNVSPRRPASEGCVVSRVTMSARTPAGGRRLACAGAPSAASNSARPVRCRDRRTVHCAPGV